MGRHGYNHPGIDPGADYGLCSEADVPVRGPYHNLHYQMWPA